MLNEIFRNLFKFLFIVCIKALPTLLIPNFDSIRNTNNNDLFGNAGKLLEILRNNCTPLRIKIKFVRAAKIKTVKKA